MYSKVCASDVRSTDYVVDDTAHHDLFRYCGANCIDVIRPSVPVIIILDEGIDQATHRSPAHLRSVQNEVKTQKPVLVSSPVRRDRAFQRDAEI